MNYNTDNNFLTSDIVNTNYDDEGSENEDESGVLREQDRFLPIAIIARIMKRAIPSNAKIAKDARECCQECVSEFISFITSEAADRCQAEKRKTINGEDILYAMSQLGFDNYVEPLKLYLQKYRNVMKGEAGGAAEGFDVLGSEILVNEGEHQTGSSVIIAYDGSNQIHGFQLG